MYPRPSGHCISHHIPAEVITLQCEVLPSRKEMDDALNYLKKQGADLVKGDLVIFDADTGYRNLGVTIYDGNKIIDLSDEPDEYGTLPQIFRVIEDGVPVDYWSDRDKTDTGRGITHNSIVWFDHSEVLQQCLQNILYSRIEGGMCAINTYFRYSGKNCRIIFDHTNETWEICNKKTLDLPDSTVSLMEERFRSQLKDTKNLLCFQTDCEFYGELPKETTLFLPIN